MRKLVGIFVIMFMVYPVYAQDLDRKWVKANGQPGSDEVSLGSPFEANHTSEASLALAQYWLYPMVAWVSFSEGGYYAVMFTRYTNISGWDGYTTIGNAPDVVYVSQYPIKNVRLVQFENNMGAICWTGKFIDYYGFERWGIFVAAWLGGTKWHSYVNPDGPDMISGESVVANFGDIAFNPDTHQPGVVWCDTEYNIYYKEFDGENWVGKEGHSIELIYKASEFYSINRVLLDFSTYNYQPHAVWSGTTLTGHAMPVEHAFYSNSEKNWRGYETMPDRLPVNAAGNISIEFDKGNRLQVAGQYEHWPYPDTWFVMWNGTEWTGVGGSNYDMVSINAYMPTVQANSSEGRPFVAYYSIDTHEVMVTKWRWWGFGGLDTNLPTRATFDKYTNWYPSMVLDTVNYPHLVWTTCTQISNSCSVSQVRYAKWWPY